MGPIPHVLKNVVNLPLRIGYQVNIVYYRYLEGLMAPISHHRKHKTVVGVQEPLIEKQSSVQNSQMGATLNISYDLGLERERIQIRHYKVIKLLNINYGASFSRAVWYRLLYYKHWKAKGDVSLYIHQKILALQFIKYIIHQLLQFIIKWINLSQMADTRDCQLSFRKTVIHFSSGILTKPDISQTEANSATKEGSFSTATQSLYT